MTTVRWARLLAGGPSAHRSEGQPGTEALTLCGRPATVTMLDTDKSYLPVAPRQCRRCEQLHQERT